jgi:predicted nucleotidyltransferase
MTAEPGLVFADAWQRAERFNFDGVTAPVLSLDDILLAKRTANRHQDRIAVKELKLAKVLRERSPA